MVLCASCSNHKISNQPITLPATNVSVIYRDYEKETEKSIYDVAYPQFPEYSQKVNQAIKKAAYPILNDFPDGGEYNVDCRIRYEVKLKSKTIISIAFDGSTYWYGAAHPISEYHTVNVDLQTGKRIRLSDVININKENVLFLLEHNRNDVSANWLAEEVRDRYCNDELGVRRIADADSDELVDSVFSYFTPEVLVIRLPWYDKHIALEIPWDKLEKIGLKYSPFKE
jgi:hypothetical protein